MACRFTELIIDANDPPALADFWAQVLDYRISDTSDEWVQIEGRQPPTILFAKVLERKTVKNRVHIDVNATDRSQEEEVERIVGLGARHADVGQKDVSWVVLADPEGNEFCVLQSRVPPL
jgi:predicted enzyme related to lactoylglutathione lyase